MKKQAKSKMRRSVVLCLPHYGDVPFKPYASVLNLLLFKQDKYYIKSIATQDALYVDYNRNLLTEGALRYNADYMFWLDSDMVIAQDTLLRLMEHDKDIVSGLYFNRKTFEPIMYLRGREKHEPIIRWDKDSLLKVDAIGMGCVLIKSDVFRNIPPPWFLYNAVENVSEDIYFCVKAKEAGYDIWVDPAVLPGHIGESEVGIEHFRAKFRR